MASKKVEIEIGAKNTTGKATKAAEKNLTSLGNVAKTVGPLLTAALGAAVVKSSVQAFIRQEAAIAQLEQRLKSTGGAAGFTSRELQAMAAELQNVTTFGDEATIEMQSLLLTFTQIQGPVFARAQESILNVAQAMGTDLKSAAIQVGKALNDPKGQLSALSRSGIQFSEDQKEMIKTMQLSGDVAGAQTVILKELETQFGGAARAAKETAGGAFISAGNSLGDLSEILGKAIIESTGFKQVLQDIPGIVNRIDRAINGIDDAGRIKEINSEIQGLNNEITTLGNLPMLPQIREDRIQSRTNEIEKLRLELEKLESSVANVTEAQAASSVIAPGISEETFGPLPANDIAARQQAAAEANQATLDMMLSQEGIYEESRLLNQQAAFMRRRDSEQLAAEEILGIQQATRDNEQQLLDERLAALNAYSTGFSSIQAGLAANSKSSGDAMFKAAQITGAAIATVDTYVAAIQATKDPSAITPAQKFLNYALVVGKGLSAVAAIRGVTSGGGGSLSAGGGGAGGGAAPIEQPRSAAGTTDKSMTVIIEGSVIGNDEDIENRIIPGIIRAVDRDVTGSGGRTIAVR